MRASLKAAVSRFHEHRILVLGDLMLDEYIEGECARISPEAPVPVLAVGASRDVLGGAGNTAANIAALGGEVTMVGLIGGDEAGRAVSGHLNARGVEFLPIADGRPTARKLRVVSQQQQLLRLDFEDTRPIGAATEDAVLDAVSSRLEQASSVVISDYAKGLLTHRVCQEVIRRAHGRNLQVFIDPRPQHAAFYVGCDYLTPNWKESQALVERGDSAPTDDAIALTGRLLAQRFGARILMTLGARGMQFFGIDGTALFSVPALAREVFDVSGAGDTVVATFALARSAGCEDQDAMTLANRGAGVVVGKLGTATLSAEELLSDDEEPVGPEARLIERSGLAHLAQQLRADRRRIVTVNGSFDVIHAGHLHILHEARRQGDVLIVGLNSDSSVRTNKGAGRPFVPERDRARMLLAVRDVDYVHIFPEPEPMAFLDEVRPDVHVNGAEYGDDCVEAPVVRAHGGRIHLVDRLPGLSTSDLVKRIQSGS